MPRNVSGTYSLPLPPVVPNTVIQAAWANTTTDDIAQGITDSLDRNGRGGMIAPFRLVDGSELQPAFAFASETGTGLYKVSPGIMGVSIMGTKVAQWSAASYDLLGDLNLAGNLGVTGDILFAGDILGTITVTGGIAVQGGISSFDDISVTEDFNGDAGFYATNINAGAHAYAVFRATNNLGHSLGVAAIGSGNTDNPANADTGLIFSDHSQGLSLITSAGAGVIRFYTAGFNEQMRINAAGNLLIGSSSVISAGSAGNVTLNHATSVEMVFGANGIGYGYAVANPTMFALGAFNAAFLRFDTGGVERMRIDAAGSLIVAGSSSFSGNLVVSRAVSGGDVKAYVINTAFAGNSRAILEISNGGTTAGSDAFTHYVNQGTWDWSTGIHAQTSSYRIGVSSHLAAPVLTVTTGQQVGIGNSSPGFTLDVQSPTTGVPGLHVDVAGAPNQGMLKLGDRSAIAGGGDYTGWQFIDASTTRVYIGTNGYLGINTGGAAAYPIDVTDGSAAVARLRHTAGASAFLQANANVDVRVGSLSNHPLYLISNGAQRMAVPEQASFPIYEIQNGISYALALDPGGTPTTVPIGGLAMGRIFGALPALQYGSSAAFSGAGGVTILGAGGATVNLNYGTWRFIGRDTNATNVDCTLWIRIG